MKRNKLLSFLLAGTLLVGGTFLGTKALFSDSEQSENALILTTGKVDINVNSQDWLRNVVDKDGDNRITPLDSPYKQEGLEKSNTGEFKNVQPGDTFSRYINILNKDSTYDVLIDISDKLNIDDETLREHIEIDKSNLVEGVKKLGAGLNSGGYITIKIKNTDEAWEAFNGAGTVNLNNIYTITATQNNN